MKIKKGDQVKVINGKDKGKTGSVEKVFTKTKKVLIAGVNIYKRHKKGRFQGQKSEIIDITKPLPEANVQLVCPKCHVLTRVGYRVEKGKKVRICRKCEQII